MDPEGALSAHGASEATGETIRNDLNLLLLLQIDLVANHLMQYLTLAEMKVLSKVSKDALAAVRRSSEFSQRAQLIINRETFSSGALKQPYFWKNVAFDMSMGLGYLGAILSVAHLPQTFTLRQVLDSAHSLRLYDSWANPLFIRDISKQMPNLLELDLHCKTGDTGSDRFFQCPNSSLICNECLIIKADKRCNYEHTGAYQYFMSLLREGIFPNLTKFLINSKVVWKREQ